MSSKLESDVCCRLQVAPSVESYGGNRRHGIRPRLGFNPALCPIHFRTSTKALFTIISRIYSRGEIPDISRQSYVLPRCVTSTHF